jgi:hypothetical protein
MRGRDPVAENATLVVVSVRDTAPSVRYVRRRTISKGRKALRQFGPVKMPALKKAHRHLKNLGLPDSERKLLAAFRSRAGGIQLFLVGFPGHFPFDHDPSTAFGTSDARADDPISHFAFSVNDFFVSRISMTRISPASVWRNASAIADAAEFPARPRHPASKA